MLSAPSAQNAVDVFAGEWTSRFPDAAGVAAGPLPLFEDERVAWALERMGRVDGRRILELGPLEGAHTYQLVNAGAEVVAIEAHTRAFLKCLVAKELLGMDRAHFLLGDFMAYLRGEPERFDLCFASGVLYHMTNPVELLALLTRVADRLFLWTVYYDEALVRGSELLARRFSAHTKAEHAGFAHTLHRFEYGGLLSSKGFAGGSAPHGNWLSRAELFAALAHVGWRVDEVEFDTDHPHGPALGLVATRAHPEAL